MFNGALNTALVMSHSYIAFILITVAFKNGIDEFVCKPNLLVFQEHFLYFFCFLSFFLRYFASHQNTAVSLEFSLRNSPILRPFASIFFFT